MKAIRKKDLIANVYKQWRKQYSNADESSEHGRIAIRLKDEKPKTEARVAEIIGNNSWTRNRCVECGNDFEVTIQLGEEPDYESATVNICVDCLKKAISLL